ncbi:hypothetical protein BC835DRAFT_1403795 [Cytidiella melzeri]|nr:hypothetical protein BC835DRAFT_1403795 [Cytidiella melzeri]
MEVASKTKEEREDEEENDEEAGSGEEEEYEIEAIVRHDMTTFENGQIGYLVKWKGYSDEHNSWVKEEDAGNAQDLIDAYWKKRGGKQSTKKPAPRKSDVKAKNSAVLKRHSSSAMIEDSDGEPPSAPPKKRGRPAKTSISDDDERSASLSKTTKRLKKSTGSASAKSAPIHDIDDDEDEAGSVQYTDMKKWKNVPSWDHIVERIETVERTEDDKLVVYFVLKSQDGKQGGLCRENSEVCKQKMPQMLLNFYESNLRWRQTNDD